MDDTAVSARGRALLRQFGTATRTLYHGQGPAGPAGITTADNLVLRSAAYRRLRPWIVSHGLAARTILAIKALHTMVFAVLMGFVLLVTVAGIRDRFTRRTGLALLTVVGEALIVVLNRGRCPLTVVVEDLGDEHGSVSDIFLPRWLAWHIPHISSGLLGLGLGGLALHRLTGRR